MEGKKFSTPLATFEIRNGIVFSRFLPVTATLDMANEHVRIIKEELSSMVPMLSVTDITNADMSGNKQIRDRLNAPDIAGMNKATAVIAASMIARMAGNLYMRFSKITSPISFFGNEESALKWLEQHK